MDLLFRRYASPFLFMDGMISTDRLTEFVHNIVDNSNKENEETTMWEFFLNKVHGESYEQFLARLKDEKPSLPSDDDLKAMVENSMNSFDIELI